MMETRDVIAHFSPILVFTGVVIVVVVVDSNRPHLLVCHLVPDPDMSIIIALHGNLHGTFTDLHGLR